MAKRAIRPRADCPGCGYRHFTIDGVIYEHSAPGGGRCGGSGAVGSNPTETKGSGPGPQSGGKVLVSDGGIVFFTPWPKIARLSSEVMVCTEKLDGTNACIQFQPKVTEMPGCTSGAVAIGDYVFAAQSRSRIITPEQDNAGFARWVHDNVDSLFADLGYGIHFMEWYGAGIQRRYGLDHKRAALFNTHRWDAKRGHFETPNLDVVPLLHVGPVDTEVLRFIAADLYDRGSRAVPGWDKPEGVVAYLTATKVSWKITDAKPGPEKHASAG